MASTAVPLLPTTTAVKPLTAADRRRLGESLFARAVTFVAVLIAVVIIAIDFDSFNRLYAYRYMFYTSIIGIAYTIVQMGLLIYYMVTSVQVGGTWGVMVDFYGDKALSFLLATAAAAGLGLTVDINLSLNKAIIAGVLIFIGFIAAAVQSVYSSFHLPKFN